MFDIGFSEMIVIAVVALIVLGPERLPKAARTAGELIGRLQRYVSGVKADIERELQLEELKKLQAQIESQARELQETMRRQAEEVQAPLRQSVEEARQALAVGEPLPSHAAEPEDVPSAKADVRASGRELPMTHPHPPAPSGSTAGTSPAPSGDAREAMSLPSGLGLAPSPAEPVPVASPSPGSGKT